MSVQPASIIGLMRDELRACGLPVRVLLVDNNYELHHEPDECVVLRSWIGLQRKAFTAPLFRWAFDDGRRFQGRPEVQIKHGHRRCTLAGLETAEYDAIPMLQQVSDMIRRSFENGAD